MPTSNPPSVLDEDAFRVTRTIDIAAPLDRVWAAVTEPAHISAWFGRTELDAAGAGSMTFGADAPIPLRRDATDPMRSVTYSWNNDDAAGTPPPAFDPATATTFTFTLEPTATGTRLTVVETGFERTSAPVANLRSHGEGWRIELDLLVAGAEAS